MIPVEENHHHLVGDPSDIDHAKPKTAAGVCSLGSFAHVAKTKRNAKRPSLICRPALTSAAIGQPLHSILPPVHDPLNLIQRIQRLL